MSLLSYIYGLVTALRNYCYDKGIFRKVRTKTKVISVGNLTVGGTGKTPFTIALAEILASEGLKIAVAGRGYGRKSHADINSLESPERITPDEAGDEICLIARKTGVPVFISGRKYKACLAADNHGFDIIIVDDGFQHRKISRSLDIVVIDKRTLSEKYLLPEGRLREPLKNLKRADVLVLRDIDKENFPSGFAISDDFIILNANSRVDGFFRLGKGTAKKRFEDFSGLHMSTVTGIELPAKFYDILLKNIPGINIIKKFEFKDHHRFTGNDTDDITAFCKANGLNDIFTTEKDAMKLEEFSDRFQEAGISVWVSDFRFEIGNMNILRNMIREISR